jgi:hypothetical protein
MAVIKTGRNFVCAYEPLPEDRFVETWLNGSEERHLLLTETIDHYDAAVKWAVGMADQMASPMEVIPITEPEHLLRNRARVASL